ncbi:EF-hand domain-containing protein 1-like [Argonauta hians]
MKRSVQSGIGGDILDDNQLNEQELQDLANYQSLQTYGAAKPAPPPTFIPDFVHLANKVLRFFCFFKETVNESPQEFYRIRPCKIFYYLVDDTIAINEPPFDNSGMTQGKFLKKQKIPKNDQMEYYHWSDINIGWDIGIYGRVFHVYDCDKFTKTFLESEGVELNPPEPLPADPYTENRKKASLMNVGKTPSPYDKFKQFLEMDPQVLRYYCLWDTRKMPFGDVKEYIINYYLSNDTLEVRAIHRENDGMDPFPVFIGRSRIPINRLDLPSTHPAVALESTEKEIKEYITPAHFTIGKTVKILNRDFLVYDFDNFTKSYYNRYFGITDFTPLDVSHLLPDRVGPVPKTMTKKVDKEFEKPVAGQGSTKNAQPSARQGETPHIVTKQNCEAPEGFDPEQSVAALNKQAGQSAGEIVNPSAEDKEIVCACDPENIALRFEAVMDSVLDENYDRRFIISFRLSDKRIFIYEPPVRNSGITLRKFLTPIRIRKPDSPIDDPVYYDVTDFYIGAVINVFQHRFIITNADMFVLKYMEKNPHIFSSSAIEGFRNKVTENITADVKVPFNRKPGDLESMVAKTVAHLKSIGFTDKTEIYEMFLKYNKDREGYLKAANIQNICRNLHLPTDRDVIDEIVKKCTDDPEGRISLEQFRLFIEGN